MTGAVQFTVDINAAGLRFLMLQSHYRSHSNWAWPLTDVRPLEPPVPARGAQGFWNWSGGEAYAR